MRNFEAFKELHVGMISEISPKSLPEIARSVGLKDGQSLHHFLRDAAWEVSTLRETRVGLIKQIVGERPMVLCIDETGDAKRGKTTDYVAKQYIIVSVNAYGVVDGMTKPKLITNMSFAPFDLNTYILQAADPRQTSGSL